MSISDKIYPYRKPYPNKYVHCIDNGTSMLECPKCLCRIQEVPFSYAVGNHGYKFCPYCGADLRAEEQMNIFQLLEEGEE